MKKLQFDKVPLENMVESYTQTDDGNTHRIVFNVKPEQRMNLINSGFGGGEEIIRITRIRKSNLVEFRIWDKDGKSFSWTVGRGTTLVSDIISEQGKQIQRLAEKLTKKSFDPYGMD